MGMQWYIIHTYSGFEKKVKESLESRVEAFNLQDKIGHVAIAADRGRSGRHYQPRAYAAGPPETESGFRAQRAGAHRGWPVCEFQRQRRRNRQRSQPFEGFGDDFWTAVIVVDFFDVAVEIRNDHSRLKVSVTIFGRSTPKPSNGC